MVIINDQLFGHAVESLVFFLPECVRVREPGRISHAPEQAKVHRRTLPHMVLSHPAHKVVSKEAEVHHRRTLTPMVLPLPAHKVVSNEAEVHRRAVPFPHIVLSHPVQNYFHQR